MIWSFIAVIGRIFDIIKKLEKTHTFSNFLKLPGAQNGVRFAQKFLYLLFLMRKQLNFYETIKSRDLEKGKFSQMSPPGPLCSLM